MNVESFIRKYGIDAESAKDLRSCPPEVQQIVLEKGTLEGTNNPSGALIGRIKRARLQVGDFSRTKGFRKVANLKDVRLEVEMFIAEAGVDDNAANDLRGCPPEVQKICLERGSLEGVDNPSGALIGRIKNARVQARSGAAKRKVNPKQLAKEVETLLAEGGADEESANDLRGCPPEVQQIVLSRGSLSGTNNPSGALIGRIKRARQEVKGGGGKAGGGGGGGGREKSELELLQMLVGMSGGGGSDGKIRKLLAGLSGGGGGGGGGGKKAGGAKRKMSKLESFIAEGGVDDESANDLRGCSPEVQKIVMEKGSLEDANNPSGALIGRIKRARLQTGDMSRVGGGGGGSRKKGRSGDDGEAELVQMLAGMLGGRF